MNAPPLIHAAVTMRTHRERETALAGSVLTQPRSVCLYTSRTIRSIENGRVLLAIIHSGGTAARHGSAAFIERSSHLRCQAVLGRRSM